MIDVREPCFIHRARAPAVAAVVDGVDIEARLQEIPRHFAEFFAALRVAVQHNDRARGRRLFVQLGVQRAAVLKRQESSSRIEASFGSTVFSIVSR